MARFGWVPGGEPTQAAKKRRLWVTRLWGKHKSAYDTDNLLWGFKPLIDEIKVQGWIKEDSPKWVERIYKQEKSPDGVDRIIIRIEELEDE
jgi:Holliday junction resolvase RusA-like endonuclease